MSQEVSTERIAEIINRIEHPEIAATFHELGMLGNISNQEGRISVEIRVPFPNIPIKDYLAGMVEAAIKKEFPDVTVSFTFSVMSDEVRARFLGMARQRWKGEI